MRGKPCFWTTISSLALDIFALHFVFYFIFFSMSVLCGAVLSWRLAAAMCERRYRALSTLDAARSHLLLCVTVYCCCYCCCLLLLRQIKAPISIRTDVSSMKNVDRITTVSGFDYKKEIFVVYNFAHWTLVGHPVFIYLHIFRWFPLSIDFDTFSRSLFTFPGAQLSSLTVLNKSETIEQSGQIFNFPASIKQVLQFLWSIN